MFPPRLLICNPIIVKLAEENPVERNKGETVQAVSLEQKNFSLFRYQEALSVNLTGDVMSKNSQTR